VSDLTQKNIAKLQTATFSYGLFSNEIALFPRQIMALSLEKGFPPVVFCVCSVTARALRLGSSDQFNKMHEREAIVHKGGDENVVDDLCDSFDFVAARRGYQLHDRWLHSHFAGDCPGGSIA